MKTAPPGTRRTASASESKSHRECEHHAQSTTQSYDGRTISSPAIAFTHDGSEAKVMGTVTAVAADHLMVTTIDGREQMINVNTDTPILRGKMALKTADLNAGTRVLITVTDKEPLTAIEIQLGGAAGPTR